MKQRSIGFDIAEDVPQPERESSLRPGGWSGLPARGAVRRRRDHAHGPDRLCHELLTQGIGEKGKIEYDEKDGREEDARRSPFFHAGFP